MGVGITYTCLIQKERITKVRLIFDLFFDLSTSLLASLAVDFLVLGNSEGLRSFFFSDIIKDF